MTWNRRRTRCYEQNPYTPQRGGEYSDDQFPTSVKRWREERHKVTTLDDCEDHISAMSHEAACVRRRMNSGCFDGRGNLRLIGSEMEQVKKVQADIAERLEVAA